MRKELTSPQRTAIDPIALFFFIVIITLPGLSIRSADWVITGEGRFDSQSLHGKVVSGIARLAREHGTRVGVLAGSVLVSREEAEENGVHDFEGASPEEMPLETAMARGAELLEEAARRLASRELSSRA